MKCKKIVVKDKDNFEKTLLGIITKEDDRFIWFRTSNKKYRFSKDKLQMEEDTDIDFIEGKSGDADG